MRWVVAVLSGLPPAAGVYGFFEGVHIWAGLAEPGRSAQAITPVLLGLLLFAFAFAVCEPIKRSLLREPR